MATPILTQHYTIKEFQLLVKDAPVVPAEIQPFVGIQFRCSNDIYRTFEKLASLPVETFIEKLLDIFGSKVSDIIVVLNYFLDFILKVMFPF